MNDHIIEMIENRMKEGAKKYGSHLDPHDGRNWSKEALEELLDACVYLSAGLINVIQSMCEHKNTEYHAREWDTNVPESLTCEDCYMDLEIHEPEFEDYVMEKQ